ncbi:Adenosylmethionine-8-amino-7-oxononanoate aminotransferase [Corynebacterium atrinae]|nr:adenosylmethionine--8-amino-7-oxononanoate transaminase [Corynebacterium atrinae]WJY63309.1 Adenosylmethionine-8-amino-7-oxononanoate aminotransferase [Corynebacterium atrinae]
MVHPLDPADVQRLDSAHIWHPYAAAGTPALPVESASGVTLALGDGREVIDAMSSWWAVVHGHSHPRLVAAAHRQAETMSHVMFGGLTHRPAVELAQALIEVTDPVLTKVFYSDSGSVAVEVAIKMALQYQRGIGHPERRRLLTWRGGYHGDTFAAMSVCDPEGGMHALWEGTLAQQVFAPAPPARGATPDQITEYVDNMDGLIADDIAALIIEPIVQGAGGMRFHDRALVAAVRELCERKGILFIADEIASGWGRAGKMFATEGLNPDILCVGKALTGGFMTLAATLTTQAVADAIKSPAGGGALMHGPTFMANPLACAVATESVRMLQEGQWRVQVPAIESALLDGLEPLRQREGVADVRVLGAIGVVEMAEPVDMSRTTAAALDHGVWIRPFGRLIYVMPPYICTPEHIATICAAVDAAVGAATKRTENQ